MATTNIKDIITHLCKLVNLVCGTNLKPEYFRLAKFNKKDDNVIPNLWDATFRILSLNTSKLDDLKKKMLSLEYSRKEFYNKSKFEDYSSREILIALGYILAKHLNKIMEVKIMESVFSNTYQLKLNKRSCKKTSSVNTNNLSLKELENYEMWMNSLILLNKRGIEDYVEQISRIQIKLNKQFDLKVTGPLTVYELLALKNKKFEDQFLEDSREILQILSVYTKWLKVEKTFWKWMGTVMEENNKEAVSND